MTPPRRLGGSQSVSDLSSSVMDGNRRTGESLSNSSNGSSVHNESYAQAKEFCKLDIRSMIRQKHLVTSLQDFADRCQNFDFSLESEYEARALQHRYNVAIKPCMEELKSLISSIEDDGVFEDLSYQAQCTIDFLNEAYSKILSFLDKPAPPKFTADHDPRSTTTPHRSLELEELKLHAALLPSVPMFHGEISLFPEFILSFNHAVHDRKISAIQKLAALRSKLSGTPLRLVEHFGSTLNDYQLAYKTLKDYYTGKNRTAAALLNNFLELKSVEKLEIRNIEEFYSSAKNLTGALQNLELPDLGDYMMFTLIFNKLPCALRDKFIEDQPNYADAIPTTDQLNGFLTEQLTVLRARPSAQRSDRADRHPSPARSTSSRQGSGPKTFSPKIYSATQPKPDNTKTPNGCFFCGGNHFLYHCAQFKKGNFQTRSDFVNRNKLCRVCLSPKHETSTCPSSRSCSRCQDKHHYLLHPFADNSKTNSRPNSPRPSNFQKTSTQTTTRPLSDDPQSSECSHIQVTHSSDGQESRPGPQSNSTWSSNFSSCSPTPQRSFFCACMNTRPTTAQCNHQ